MATQDDRDGESVEAETAHSGDHAGYWRANLRIVGACLVVWFAVSFGCGILFVEQLNTIRIGGFQLGFWFAQQGSIYTFLILTFYYAWRMNRLDREYGVAESES